MVIFSHIMSSMRAGTSDLWYAAGHMDAGYASGRVELKSRGGSWWRDSCQVDHGWLWAADGL